MSVSGESPTVSGERAGDPLGSKSKLAGLGRSVDKRARGRTAAAQGAAGRLVAAAPHTGSICGSDERGNAACYTSADPVAYGTCRSVARILAQGVEVCTAWRAGT